MTDTQGTVTLAFTDIDGSTSDMFSKDHGLVGIDLHRAAGRGECHKPRQCGRRSR
jgi:hypothetical protein